MSAQALVDRLEWGYLTDALHADDHNGWQPLPLADFLGGLAVCREALGLGAYSFLDVGSGIGSKLLLAQRAGFMASGIERHGPYVETSRRLFPDLPVRHADAFGVGSFSADAVYSFRLCSDYAEQERLNRHITDGMRSGSLFWCVGPPWPVWLEHVEEQVWRMP